jgi:hypothetical protein
MAPNVVFKPELVALLSAASLADIGSATGQGRALQPIAGQSLLACQMQALQRAGVSSFLIEVDTIPGELLNLADDVRNRGVRVEFVRSAKDMQALVKPEHMLVVQAEAHYFSSAIVGELVSKSAPFVATIDGRDENASFERIDLNTRWAGFAVINGAMARSMAELPDGWSIASSLLRTAVQGNVRLEPLAQAAVQSGAIMPVSGEADADRIVAQMLSDRSRRPDGLIERHLFAPAAKMLAPTIWLAPQGEAIVGVSRMVFAGGSAGLAMLGWSVAAATSALLAVFLNTVFEVISGVGEDKSRDRWQGKLLWAAVVLAALAIAWTHSDYGSDPVAFVLMSTGLSLLAHKITLPRWCAGLLKSPALLVSAMLVATTAYAVASGVKLVALAQLGLIIGALYLPHKAVRNNEQA